MKVKKTADLFLTMLKVGLFTFGGGYAMLALLEREFVVKKKWLETNAFLDMVAIAESTPGPIAINAATYIGYTLTGFSGALCATVAVCIPSFVILYGISLFLDTFLSWRLVAYAFHGIQVCVIYLIFSAGLRMLKSLQKSMWNLLIFCAVTVCMAVFSLLAVRFSTILSILFCGVLGVVVFWVKRTRAGKDGRS